MTKKDNWKLIGYCPVDSGQLVIADPCYVLPDGGKAYTYKQLLEERGDSKEPTQQITFSGIRGDGIVFDSGDDGVYPVYGRFDNAGRVLEVKVKLKRV